MSRKITSGRRSSRPRRAPRARCATTLDLLAESPAASWPTSRPRGGRRRPPGFVAAVGSCRCRNTCRCSPSPSAACRRPAPAATRRTRSPGRGPSLWATTVPPCSSTSRLTSVSPMPRPPWDRSSVWSTWRNISKICESMCLGMPGPLSRMRTTPRSASRSTPIQMTLAAGRIFGRVVQDVAEDLRQPGDVAFDDDRLGRQRQSQPVAAATR